MEAPTVDPISLSYQVEERYRRYLKTTFYFKDPDLRTSFEEALKSGHLSKGPYLEATPTFKLGQTPQKLFNDLLGFQFDSGFLKSVHGERPLYKHQDQAIRCVFQGHNVVVATGTGSGKTEAFLYPILLHLYKEFHSGQLGSGVRALILYPMNALANDQRDRLGEICDCLHGNDSPFRFSFGQYIGETPEDENDSWRHARDHISNRLPGELVLRSEMRKSPPHILLTNYSMLEYLLLRPDDSPLFDNGRAKWWRFLVLDEAHQYRGSRGIEMAMLLRRVKQRLREGGRSEPFNCIATSATLGEGEKDKLEIAHFASRLFGEKFNQEDMILGETEKIPEPGPNSLLPNDYRFLAETINDESKKSSRHLFEIAKLLNVQISDDEDILKIIGRFLQWDHRSAYLRSLITSSPLQVREIADQIFSDLQPNERVSVLSDLVELLILAKDPATNTPLLSARYHLLLRSLEGAFVAYWPQKMVFLDKKAIDEKSTLLEVALCRECGQHYFVGPNNFRGGKLTEPNRDPSNFNFGATFFRPIDDDEEDDFENFESNDREIFQLCVQCGEMSRSTPTCGHENFIRLVKEESPKDEDRADQMKKCSVCGYHGAGRDPVREVVHGTDGPNAVIATTLYQYLPEERKKVLAFADGRQEAAFFAWYLEDSYKDIMRRNLFVKVVKRLSPYTTEGLTLRELATGLRDIFRESKIFPPTMGGLELRREAWLGLYREFLTDEPRISLEGVGLARWLIKWPDWFIIPDVLRNHPWSLTQEETKDLVFILLNSMRSERAVELQTEEGISLSWSDLGLQATQMCVRIGPPRQPKGRKNWNIKSWDGTTGKRARFLAKLLVRNGFSEQQALDQAVELLRVIWDAIRRSDELAPSANDRLLLSVDDARRLNPNWWRLRLITNNDTVFQCVTCGRVQAVSIHNGCSRHGCTGTLKQIRLGDMERNHYRLLYEEDLPGSIRVEEHTAQLDHEKAREFQKDFKKGKIHVLSCSTTFELGVDLGDLDNIFLRNVPPEAFNYAQRVGRAGRRHGYPGFAITYCRRVPHDLYHFAEPERMIIGKVRPPVLNIQNEKIIIRHIAAVAFSRFFRNNPQRFKHIEDRSSSIARLFIDIANPSVVNDFNIFLHEYREEIEESLHSIVPQEMKSKVGLPDGTWMNKIAGNESRFYISVAEVSNDYRTIRELRKVAFEKGDDKTVGWAGARAKTIAGEDVLSFLSRKAIIPKYGFPVDVVELDTQRTQNTQESMEISLQRDLTIAVSEFAPTSKLIANKKVWTSYGLKRVAEKEWDRWWYGKCVQHNYFIRGKLKEDVVCKQCCNSMMVARYIDPLFGFVTSRDRPKEPKMRPVRSFTTRPYFAGFRDQRGDMIPFDMITLTKVSPGYLVVLCEGRRGDGFYICGQCGAGDRKREYNHKTPYGQECQGILEQVSLGHEFVTDILQLQFLAKSEEGIDSNWFAFSLAYALVEGAAEILEVPSTDISTTVAYGTEGCIPPIILYDNVPGGAGLVAELEKEDVLRKCLKSAYNRVNGKCGCGETTSCYGCLRNYRNQFSHQYLQRGLAMRYLEKLLSVWK